MSDQQFFCEYCGYYSDNQERCSHCGRDIAELFTQPVWFRVPEQGRLTIRLSSPDHTEHIWRELAELWDRLERETSLGLYPGQMKKFPPTGDTLELYGSELEIRPVQELLKGRGTVEFQKLPCEQIPHRPKYQLPRPPTVPRNKR
ncbi:hypothetical protein [Archangium sp.]|uniref:hypothetical protein n=1 Tax=Archangium sp. TaxID=1872627 RepID=UPI00389A6A31